MKNNEPEAPEVSIDVKADLAHLAYTGGTTMVVFPRFEPQEYLNAVKKYNATVLGGAPQLFIPLVNLPNFKDIDLSSVKLVSSGAAPLALPVLDKMLNAFSGTVCEAYGMTECTMDADGYFYITDRQKDMIIYKGYNVYPRELEEVLFTHPDVAQCAVIGKPDLAVGEAPVAFVQLMPEVQADKNQLMEFINEQVAAYKKIREIRFLDAIPVSAAGKVLKRELRYML